MDRTRAELRTTFPVTLNAVFRHKFVDMRSLADTRPRLHVSGWIRSACLIGCALFPSAAALAADSVVSEYRIAETIELDRVPSWFPVDFCLLTHEDRQYAAYYDAEHRMIMAHRRLGDTRWEKTELPTKVVWDSHNYITLAVDRRGDLHVAGNMHCVPLIYFRTREPNNIATLERQTMTGREETRCTYPRFLEDRDGNLLFSYRSGGSGNGKRLYNRYDSKSKTWRRFLDTPLFEGEGKRNAYPLGPSRGPDGLFHVVWVWRDTPDCATNHHLSYARSRDLKTWESADGKPAALPMTLDQEQTWVDPIPPGGGIINGCEKLSFDSERRPIISYHKQDAKGHMQIYVARFEGGEWKRRPVTSWDRKIVFSGRGAMPFIGISLTGLTKTGPDHLVIKYRHRDFGSGRIVLDERRLKPVAIPVAVSPEWPRGFLDPTIEFPGIRVKIARDLGVPLETRTAPAKRYVLRWETLGPHFDRPRRPPLPPASKLELVTLEAIPASPRARKRKP